MFAKHWPEEILLPLCPGSLKHKNPQRHKIICGVCRVRCKDRLIDLKMFLYNIMFVISVAVLVAFVKRPLFLLCFVVLVLYNRRSIFINSVNCYTEFWSLSSD